MLFRLEHSIHTIQPNGAFTATMLSPSHDDMTSRVKMWEYDGGYYPDASPISNLPEGTFRRFSFFSPQFNLSGRHPLRSVTTDVRSCRRLFLRNS